MAPKKEKLVLGIGSPFISDDQIGLRVAEAIKEMGLPDTDVEEASVSGLDLIEMLLDYKRVIIVDAITSGEFAPGTVRVLERDSFAYAVHGSNPHETNIVTAFELGKLLEPQRFPADIKFVAIEAQNTYDISEEMTSPVKAALPMAVKTVLELLNEPQR
ncbi:MAG: hydrogenase maturation protease [Methanomassiliicoccales archaeon]